MKNMIPKLIPFTILLFFVGIFFRQTFISGKLPVPSDTLVGMYHPWLDYIAKEYPAGMPYKNFLITDPIRQQIPWRKLAIEAVKKGNVNPWNAYSFSGTPLATNIQSGFYYPFNIIFFFLPFPVAWTVLIILQQLLSGFFFYLFLKKNIQLSPYASVFGALCFMFCGFSIAWLTWGTIVQTLMWLPLLLVLADSLMRARGIRKLLGESILIGTVLAMQYFAGHSQIFLYSTFLLSAYVLFRIIFDKPVVNKRTDTILRILLSFGIFALLTSIHWIPFFSDLMNISRLQEVSGIGKEGFFIPFQNLVQFIIPDFFGNPATLNYWGIWNYGEFIGYIGVAGLFFVFCSIFSKQKSQMIFWFIMVCIGFLFALPTAIALMPYRMHIPILSSLQPTRFLSIIDFGLCVLSAIGLDAWMNNTRKRYVMIVCIVFAGLFGFIWYVVKVNPYTIIQDNLDVTGRNIIFPTVIFGLVALVVVGRMVIEKFISQEKQFVKIVTAVFLIVISFYDLSRFGWKFTPFTDLKLFFPKTEIISFLEKQPKPFRITALDDRVMPPNVSAYYGIESIAGYDPLYDSRYEKYISAMERGEPNINPPYGFNRIMNPKNISSPLFRLLGVRYILSLSDISDIRFTKVVQEGQTRVYEYMNVVPRAYLLEKITYEADEQRVFEKLYSAEFLVGKEGITEQKIDVVQNSISQNESATIVTYNSNSIEISVQTDSTRMVFIGNMFHNGWKAYIDRTQIPLYRVNYLFMGVVVPSGIHQVMLRYR